MVGTRLVVRSGKGSTTFDPAEVIVIANAAAETGRISPVQAQVWLEARRQAVAAEIGHLDLLALPPN